MSNSNANTPSTDGQNTNVPLVNNPAVNTTSTVTNPTVADAQRPLNPGLYAPNPAAPVPRDLSVFEIANALMNPPPEYQLSPGVVTLNIDWAVGKAGPERFEMSALEHRLSLVQTDELYLRGVEVGISPEVLTWLRGGEKTLVLPASHFGQ